MYASAYKQLLQKTSVLWTFDYIIILLIIRKCCNIRINDGLRPLKEQKH